MTTYRRDAANSFAGFTLVEILIVIVIIGLLAGMTTTVIVGARRSVNNSVITAQMSQLSIALDEYKNKFGEYPPDLSDKEAVKRHLKKRWPRSGYGVNDASYATFMKHVELGCALSSGDACVWKLVNDDGDPVGAYISSLVFWLGGLPDGHGVPSGFYASPKYPLGIKPDDSPVNRPDRLKKEKPLYSFDRKYLSGYGCSYDSDLDRFYYFKNENWLRDGVYIPAYCQGDYPIVYFRPSLNKGYGAKSFYLAQGDGVMNDLSCAVPYGQGPNLWYEEKRFQLIHPGDDGLFSFSQLDFMESHGNALPTNGDYEATRIVPAKSGTSLRDADNLTNFVESGTLESLYD